MIDVLIPTKDRPEKLVLTLYSLYSQFADHLEVRVTVRDEGVVGMMESREVS